LVFVSEKKAAELRTSIARPGDVVVTQRGTLGQIGLIPRDAGFDRYVLSQSQMKITVDPTKTTPEFVYSQMRSPETTQRFIARAMSSGVPHVNLKLLRDFELINPPYEIQLRYSDYVRTLDTQSWVLRRQADRLRTLRDLLLPKLVKGQIDMSSMDLDAMVEDSVA
jgi:type I restriction enzyme, S subunit